MTAAPGVGLATVEVHSPAYGDLSVDEDVAGYLEAQISSATRKAYAAQWAKWCEFAKSCGFRSFPASPLDLARWITTRARAGQAYSTINQGLGAVGFYHRGARAADDTPLPNPARDPGVRQTLTGIKNVHGTTPGRQARALSAAEFVRIMRAVRADTRNPVRAKRNAAMILLGYVCGGRRGEVTSLRFEDIKAWEEVDPLSGEVDRGLTIDWLRHKTARTGERDLLVVFIGRNSETCPVLAWEAWQAACGRQFGPAFPEVGRPRRDGTVRIGVTPILPKFLNDMLKDAVLKAGLPGVSAHSLRRSGATNMYRAGADVLEIATRFGWTPFSKQVAKYIRVDEQRSKATRFN